MSHVGPFNPAPGSKGPGDDTNPVDKEKFKQKMRQVEAVDKIDPDQKAKKRKPSQEEEEQLGAETALNAPSQPPLSAPSPLASPPSSSPARSQPLGNSSAASSPYTTPPPSTASDDTSAEQTSAPDESDGYDDFDLFDFESAPLAPPPNPSTEQSHKATHQETTKAANAKKASTTRSSSAAKKTAHTTINPQTPQAPAKKASAKLKATTTSSTLKTDEDIYKAPAEKKEAQQSSPQKKSAKAKAKQETKEHDQADITSQALAPMGPTPPPLMQTPQGPTATTMGSYLSPAVHELFQTMTGLVMVKQLTQEGAQGTQMEVSLNNPAYQASPFYGLKILLTEYKTAPGSFNIELQGSHEQNAILMPQLGKLISAFNDNRYNLPFTVNRLEVFLKKEDSDFLFKRKGSVKDHKKDKDDKQHS